MLSLLQKNKEKNGEQKNVGSSDSNIRWRPKWFSTSRLLSRCSRLVWDNISVELLHQISIIDFQHFLYQNKSEDFTFGIIRQITFGEFDSSGSSYQIDFHYSYAICSIIWILVVSGIIEDFSLFIYHTLLAVSAIIGDFSLLVNIVVHFTFHCIIAILLFTFVGYIRHTLYWGT